MLSPLPDLSLRIALSLSPSPSQPVVSYHLLAGKAGYQLFQYDPAHPCPPAGMAVPGAEKSLPPTSGTTPDSNLLSGAFFYPVFSVTLMPLRFAAKSHKNAQY